MRSTTLWLLALVVGVLFIGGGSPVHGQGAFAHGAVVALQGTPHLWIADAQGVLHWGGDTRALAGKHVNWNDRRDVSLAELQTFSIGDPWLSAGLLKDGDPIYQVKWETEWPLPKLLHIQRIEDVEIFGIWTANYGNYVIDKAAWEQRYSIEASTLERHPLASAVPLGVTLTLNRVTSGAASVPAPPPTPTPVPTVHPTTANPYTLYLNGRTFTLGIVGVWEGKLTTEQLPKFQAVAVEGEVDVGVEFVLRYMGDIKDDQRLPSAIRDEASFELTHRYRWCKSNVIASWCYRSYTTDPIEFFAEDGTQVREHRYVEVAKMQQWNVLPFEPTITKEGRSGWRVVRKRIGTPLTLRITSHLSPDSTTRKTVHVPLRYE